MTGAAAAKPLGLTCGANGGVTVSGQPCGVQLGLDEVSGLCRVHAKRAELAATVPKDLPPAPQTIADAKNYASWAIDAVAKGPAAGGLDVKRAREVSTLLRQFQSSAHEAELAARIKHLEAQLRAYKAKAKGGGTAR